MSQENVEILRVVPRPPRWSRQSDRRTSRPLAEDGGIRISSWMPPMRPCWTSTGSTAAVPIRRFWRAWLAAWETIRGEYQLVDAGDHVIAVRHADAGALHRHRDALGKLAWVSSFRDGLPVHAKLFLSHAEALEAVGLSE